MFDQVASKSSTSFKGISEELIDSLDDDRDAEINLSVKDFSNCQTYLKLYMENKNSKIPEKFVIIVIQTLSRSNKKNDKTLSKVIENLWQIKTSSCLLKDCLVKTYPQYFERLIKTVTDDFFIASTNSLNRQLLSYDSNYLEIFSTIAENKGSKDEAFQCFSRYLANWMIEENFRKEPLNEILQILLSDLKSKLGMIGFYNLYTDEQKKFIVVMSNSTTEVPKIIQKELKILKKSNFIDFVIVITHSRKCTELLDESLAS